MSATDRLRGLTAAVAQRDAAAAADSLAPPAAAAARTEPYRTSLDLQPDDHLELERWILDGTATLGRKLTQHEVIYAAVIATITDPAVGRRVLATIAGTEKRLTRPGRRRPV